jgi:hypothetical protein
VWIRRLFRAVGRGLAGAAAVLGPTVSPWPVTGLDWAGCAYGWGTTGLGLPGLHPVRRCDDCCCLPAPGHPERLVSCPPDEIERAIWAQFEFERPR